MQKLEATILDMLDQSARNIKTTPLNLGGVGGAGGGVGVPPGGFIGRLPQWAVAYDTLEAATLDTLPSGVTGASGWSLVDNLNHIRYRLNVLESGGSICVIDDDTATSYFDTTHLHFSGAGVVLNDLGGGHVQAVITATGSGGGGLDETAANALYLRLNTANNPLTNGLDIIPTTDIYGTYIELTGNKNVLDLEQYAGGAAVDADFIFGYQEADDLNVTSIFLDGVRWRSGAGAFSGNWIHFEENNVAKFDVDYNGNAYTRGELLIREAPINSLHYARRNGDWQGIIPNHDFIWFYSTDVDTWNDPGLGNFATDNNTDALVTEIALSVNGDSGQQLVQFNNMLYSGDMIMVQQVADTRYWSRYQVIGPVVNNTSWHRIPVEHILSSVVGTPPRDEDAHVKFTYLAPLIGSGGAGGGGIEEAPIDGTPYVRQDADWVTTSGWGFGSNFRHIDQSGGTSDTYGVLAGSVNGSNTVFTVSQAVYLTGSLEVYLNGQLQTQGSAEDWVETSPAAGTFTFNTAPLTGDLITVAYLKANTATGNADTVDGYHASSFVLDAEVREKLTAARTYYVRTDGSDSNTGLANTSGGAFLTIQKAINTIATLDINGYTTTVQVADGTYNEAVVLKNVVGYAGVTNLVLKGNETTPTNVVMNGGGSPGLTADGISSVWDVSGFSFSGVYGVLAQNQARVRIGKCNYAGATYYQNLASYLGVISFISSPITISTAGASSPIFLAAIDGGHITFIGITLSITANCTYSVFANAGRFSYIAAHACTINLNGNTVTGYRYAVDGNSLIFTNGGGANYFPGSIAGITGTGGQYV